MNRIVFYLFLTTLFFSNLPAQSLPIEKSATHDQNNNIRQYLNRVASEITQNSLSNINSAEQWQQIRDEKYKQFTSMMGLVDVPVTGERSPLKTQIVGTIQKQGYKIVKLHYQSLPNLYVPADLYIPDDVSTPRPAILYVCGHSRTQKVHYQPHARRFAELGFVCLIIETIQWGEIRGEHWGCYANGWFNWYSLGYTPGGVELWNAIRGLDLLCERPEVDPERLGVTGISGGGSQSWYIAAADPRIKAAAPVCGASTLEAQIHTRTIDGHCDCMMPPNTYLWDFTDIGALYAPKPLLIGQANRDGLNTIESVRDIYFRLKDFYELFDAKENISLVESPGGHSYHKTSRQKIFSFFLKHLMNKDVYYADIADVDEDPEKQLTAEELKIFTNGPIPGDRTKTIQDYFIKSAIAPDIATLADLEKHRDWVINNLKEQTFAAFPQNPVNLDPRLEFRTLDGGEFGRTVYSYVSEQDWRLKIDIHWKHPQDEPNPILIVLRNANARRWDAEGFIGELAYNMNVAYLEVRGVGEAGWAPELQWHIRRAAAWTGRTIASMQVYDLLKSIEFCISLQGVDSKKIHIAAKDEMTVIALYVALLNGSINALLLQNPPSTQNKTSAKDGTGPAIEMLNCLRFTDINQIPGLLYPMKIAFMQELPQTFNWSENIYKKLGKESAYIKINEAKEF